MAQFEGGGGKGHRTRRHMAQQQRDNPLGGQITTQMALLGDITAAMKGLVAQVKSLGTQVQCLGPQAEVRIERIEALEARVGEPPKRSVANYRVSMSLADQIDGLAKDVHSLRVTCAPEPEEAEGAEDAEDAKTEEVCAATRAHRLEARVRRLEARVGKPGHLPDPTTYATRSVSDQLHYLWAEIVRLRECLCQIECSSTCLDVVGKARLQARLKAIEAVLVPKHGPSVQRLQCKLVAQVEQVLHDYRQQERLVRDHELTLRHPESAHSYTHEGPAQYELAAKVVALEKAMAEQRAELAALRGRLGARDAACDADE